MCCLLKRSAHLIAGGVELSVPLLLPVSGQSVAPDGAVKLMDTSGNIVQLPSTLLQSFARLKACCVT